jgi:hypothetical protein
MTSSLDAGTEAGSCLYVLLICPAYMSCLYVLLMRPRSCLYVLLICLAAGTEAGDPMRFALSYARVTASDAYSLRDCLLGNRWRSAEEVTNLKHKP